MLKKSGRKRAKYLDSSVKKLFVLAITKGIPETYFNVKTILAVLKLDNITFDFCLATDLKLQNILMGIQSNSSTYPCVYCESPRPFTTIGLVRTLGRIRQLSKLFDDNGACKNDAKDYMNAIYAPLFDGEDELRVIDILSPPELHLLIGIGKQNLTYLTQICTENFRHAKIPTQNWF